VRFKILAIGQRMPSWVNTAWSEYARRFPRGFSLELNEIPAQKRNRNANIDAIKQKESQALLAACSSSSLKIALHEGGKQWSTRELSENMKQWMQAGRDIDFLVGGPDGLTKECLASAEIKWSLGRLTLPHPLVRVLLAEQLYRAWSLTQNHPYHRD
jgi:23S rRNA (pseudouridine1915-N3)-methyltransferase